MRLDHLMMSYGFMDSCLLFFFYHYYYCHLLPVSSFYLPPLISTWCVLETQVHLCLFSVWSQCITDHLQKCFGTGSQCGVNTPIFSFTYPHCQELSVHDWMLMPDINGATDARGELCLQFSSYPALFELEAVVERSCHSWVCLCSRWFTCYKRGSDLAKHHSRVCDLILLFKLSVSV